MKQVYIQAVTMISMQALERQTYLYLHAWENLVSVQKNTRNYTGLTDRNN